MATNIVFLYERKEKMNNFVPKLAKNNTFVNSEFAFLHRIREIQNSS